MQTIQANLKFIQENLYLEFNLFRGKWFVYTIEKLARLKALENFVPSGMSSDDFIQWLQARGHERETFSAEKSIKDREILSGISTKKSYRVRLDVSYTSHIFGATKICRISKKYKLMSCSNVQAIDTRDESYWKLVS